MTRPAGERRRTTTEVLREAVSTHPEEHIPLDALLAPLRSRAFGMLLLVLAIPNFIPAPIGIGGIMGVLTIVLGVQMIWGLERPWIPRRLRRKTMRRTRVEAFLDRSAKVMRWLERWCKPRMIGLTQRPWSIVSGVSLVILGALLSLPIPFTNYPFGIILLAYAFALIERDGALLIGFWILSAALIVLAIMFSHVVVEWMQVVLQYF